MLLPYALDFSISQKECTFNSPMVGTITNLMLEIFATVEVTQNEIALLRSQ
jgi:hypothetical protein